MYLPPFFPISRLQTELSRQTVYPPPPVSGTPRWRMFFNSLTAVQPYSSPMWGPVLFLALKVLCKHHIQMILLLTEG